MMSFLFDLIIGFLRDLKTRDFSTFQHINLNDQNACFTILVFVLMILFAVSLTGINIAPSELRPEAAPRS